jgi:hypothetical protein
MLTASQLCPVPSPPPPLEYAMASAVIVLKNIAIKAFGVKLAKTFGLLSNLDIT